MKKRTKTLTEVRLSQRVYRLNNIIHNTNVANCYSQIVCFFRCVEEINNDLTSIDDIPLLGFECLGFRSKRRKGAEARKKRFINLIKGLVRSPYGFDRTPKGDLASKETIFFGDVEGIATNNVAYFEGVINPHIQQAIRLQISNFVELYKDCISLDWIKD